MYLDDDIEVRYLRIIDDFGGNIIKFCTRCSDNSRDADELMQEILSALWTGIPSLQPDSTQRMVNRWLRKLMVSVLIKHLRKRPRISLMPTDMLPDLSVDEEDKGLLLDMASYLPEADRKMLHLIVDGYSPKEIAKEFGMNVSAYYTRLHRIIQKLKTIKQQYYEN